MAHKTQNVSRREFASRAAGAAAAAVTLGSAGTALAQARPPAVLAPQQQFQLAPNALPAVQRRSDLIALSNQLWTSPNQRQQFMTNPTAFAQQMGLRGLSPQDLANLNDMFASGVCCGGCGC